MHNTDSPLLVLVRRHMDLRGIDRKTLGHALADGGDPNKAFRLLDELLRGQRFDPKFIQQVSNALQIPARQLAAAQEAHDRREQLLRTEADRKALKQTMQRRGPHLWGILPPRYIPNLITIVGPEFFLLARLPKEIVELPHFEQMKEVGRLVRLHYREHRRCRLIGYEYRQSIDNVFRFSMDGEYLGRLETAPSNPRTFVSIGGREVETPLPGFKSCEEK